MIDISTVGAEVRFRGGPDTVVTQFSDEGTPFECPDVDFTTNAKNLNGEMISSRTPSVYTLSVTVIPGSDNDRDLSNFAQKCALFPSNVQSIGDLIVHQCIVTVPHIDESSEQVGGRRYIFTNGRLKSAPTGPSTSAEGRQSSRTFTFEFEQLLLDW